MAWVIIVFKQGHIIFGWRSAGSLTVFRKIGESSNGKLAINNLFLITLGIYVQIYLVLICFWNKINKKF